MNYEKIQKDFKRMTEDTKKLIDQYNKSVTSIKKEELAIGKVKDKLNELQEQAKNPFLEQTSNSIKEAENNVIKLKEKLIETEKVLQEVNSRGILTEGKDVYGNTVKYKKFTPEDETVRSSALTDKTNINVELLKTQERMSELKKQYEELNQTDPKLARNIEETKTKLQLMNDQLEESKAKANEFEKAIKNAAKNNMGKSLGQGIEDIGKKLDKFKNKMTRLIGTAMVFSLLRNSLTSLRSSFVSLLKENDTFSSSLNQIKANLMTAFAPIYNAVLPAINNLMNALSKVTGTIAVFISSLFGKSLGDAKKEAEGLSKSLKKVGKSGNDASGSLSKIDKLDVIGKNESSGGGGVGNTDTGIDYSGDIQISQRLLDFLNAIKNFVVNNKELILGLFTGIISALALMKLGISGIMSLGIGLVIAGIVTLIQGIVNFIKDPSWENFGVILEGLALILAGVAVAMLAVNAANPVAWIVLAIALITALGALIIKNWDKIKEVLGKVGSWVYDNIIAPVGNFFKGLWEGIKNIWSTCKTWWKEHVIDPIVNFFKGMWEGVKNGAKNAWEGIKNVFSTVATFFKNIFSNAWEGVKKVFSTGGKIFDGIKDGIVTAFKNVVNAIIRGINKVVALPFNGINKVLDKIQNVSFLGITPFDFLSWRAPVPQIPELAKGTVIPPRHKFAAILGDQKHGTNIEAPLETIKQANREVLTEFFDKLGALTNQVREIVLKNFTIVAQFGDRSFKQVVYEAIRLTEQELGRPLFVS